MLIDDLGGPQKSTSFNYSTMSYHAKVNLMLSEKETTLLLELTTCTVNPSVRLCLLKKLSSEILLLTMMKCSLLDCTPTWRQQCFFPTTIHRSLLIPTFLYVLAPSDSMFLWPMLRYVLIQRSRGVSLAHWSMSLMVKHENSLKLALLRSNEAVFESRSLSTIEQVTW
jgi:hypothetical protein